MTYTDVYITYYNDVYNCCQKLLNNKALAEEAVQETFIRLLTKWDSVDKKRIKPWLLKVSHNICVDIIRKESRSISLAEINLPEEESIGEALMSEVKEITKTLKPKYREIFDLVFIKGYKSREVADILQLPVSTVTSRLQIYIRELRNRLQ